MPTPKKITETVLSAMKQMKPIIEQQKTRDVSEADTVTLVKDVLSDAMGYDKYLDLTGEFARVLLRAICHVRKPVWILALSLVPALSGSFSRSLKAWRMSAR